MIKQIFTVYDSKAEAYMMPFYSDNVATACREFTQATNDQQSAFYRHAEDFTLFHIGSYDDQSALISMLPAKASVVTAIEVKKQLALPLAA